MNKLTVKTNIFVIMVITIVTFGSSVSCPLVAAASSQSLIDHQKTSVKKQESHSDANDADSSNDNGKADSNHNGDRFDGNSQQGSSDASNNGGSSTRNSDDINSDNSDNTGDTGNNIAASNKQCDQRSGCNGQQDPSDTDNPIGTSATNQVNTPFVLSLPFP
jgi:hypothetical protein